MLDKLEHIKDFYELELDQRMQQLDNNRNVAATQLKQMQVSMRQDQVNSQKQLHKLQQEMSIKQLA